MTEVEGALYTTKEDHGPSSASKKPKTRVRDDPCVERGLGTRALVDLPDIIHVRFFSFVFHFLSSPTLTVAM